MCELGIFGGSQFFLLLVGKHSRNVAGIDPQGESIFGVSNQSGMILDNKKS